MLEPLAGKVSHSGLLEVGIVEGAGPPFRLRIECRAWS